MTEAQYRASEAISKSDLDYIAPPRTPAHYKAHKDGMLVREETPAMRLGTLTHRAILEPDSMQAAFAVRPEGLSFTTKEGKAWRDAQKAPIITQEEADSIKGMVASVWAHPAAKRLLDGAKTEQCLFAEDANGMIRKGRLDALPGGSAIVDIKTTGSADAQEFERSIGKFRYHVQAAYYLDLCKLIGIEKRQFVFVAVEKQPPYGVAVYSLGQDAISLGRMEYQRDLAAVRHCTETGEWPAFGDEILIVGLPAWMQKAAEELA